MQIYYCFWICTHQDARKTNQTNTNIADDPNSDDIRIFSKNDQRFWDKIHILIVEQQDLILCYPSVSINILRREQEQISMMITATTKTFGTNSLTS